jgi:hypothetical protein
MKLGMDKTLRFWVDAEYGARKSHYPKLTKRQLIARILREFEGCGDAMRCLDRNGSVVWRAGPWLLERLADGERDYEDELDEGP